MFRFRIQQKQADPSPLTYVRNFQACQSALFRGTLDVTLENTRWVDTDLRKYLRKNFDEDPEKPQAWGFPDWAETKDTSDVTEEGIKSRLNVAWEGFDLQLIKILACGGFGAATLWQVLFEDGSTHKVVIKMGLKGDFDGAGELSWHQRYWGNHHVVQAIDLHAEGQTKRREAWENAPRGHLPHTYSGREFDMKALNVVVLEFVDGGDLFGILAKASRRHVTFTTKVLWEFFECFVLGLASVGYQPVCSANDPLLSFDEVIRTARENNGEHWDTLTRNLERQQPAHDVHFDLEEQNILCGSDWRHDYRPVFKLHDFGNTFSFDMDSKWKQWKELPYWNARATPKPQRLTPEQTHKRWDDLDTNPAHEGKRFRGANLEEGEEIAGRYGMWTNIFRIGNIMECIMTGVWYNHPFDAGSYTTQEGAEMKTYGYRLNDPKYSHLDWELRDTICQMMSERPIDRPTLPVLLRLIGLRMAEGFSETDDMTLAFWEGIYRPAAEMPIAAFPATVDEGGVREATQPTNPNTPQRIDALVARDNANGSRGKGKRGGGFSGAPYQSHGDIPTDVQAEVTAGFSKGKDVDRGPFHSPKPSPHKAKQNRSAGTSSDRIPPAELMPPYDWEQSNSAGESIARSYVPSQELPPHKTERNNYLDEEMAESSILEPRPILGKALESSDEMIEGSSSSGPASSRRALFYASRSPNTLKPRPDNAAPEFPVKILSDVVVEEDEEEVPETGTKTRGSLQPARIGGMGLTQFKVNKQLQQRGKSRANQPFPFFAPTLLGKRPAQPNARADPPRSVPSRDLYDDDIDMDDNDVAYARVSIVIPERGPSVEPDSSVASDGGDEGLSDIQPPSGSAWTTQNVSTAATSLAVEEVPDTKRQRDKEKEDGDDRDPHYTERPNKKRRQEPEFYQPTKQVSSTTRKLALKPRRGTGLQAALPFSALVPSVPRAAIVPRGQPAAHPDFKTSLFTSRAEPAASSSSAQPSVPRAKFGPEDRLAPQPLFHNLPRATPGASAPKKTAPVKKAKVLRIGKGLIPIKNKVKKKVVSPRRVDPTERLDQYINRNLANMPVAIQNLVARGNALENMMAQRAWAQDEERHMRMRAEWARQQRWIQEQEGRDTETETGTGLRKQKAKSETESG